VEVQVVGGDADVVRVLEREPQRAVGDLGDGLDVDRAHLGDRVLGDDQERREEEQQQPDVRDADDRAAAAPPRGAPACLLVGSFHGVRLPHCVSTTWACGDQCAQTTSPQVNAPSLWRSVLAMLTASTMPLASLTRKTVDEPKYDSSSILP